MARFLIVDDHPLFREALTSALRLVDAEADIYEATSIEGALDVLDAHDDFELALIDLSLPGTTGFSGLIRLRTSRPKLPILVVSGHEEPAVVREALTLGIAGYVPKSTSKKRLAEAIAKALAGDVYEPELPRSGAVEGRSSQESLILQRLRDLTPQQLAVLELVREGRQNKVIAHELKLAETTIKAHVSEVLRKLGVASRTQAVIEVAKVDFEAVKKMQR
jgi:DNA-binding NarL/FixJ family response regulator